MCLLMRAPSNTLRHVLLSTPGLIEDIYSHNEDGYGVMYGSASGPKIIKKLPKSANQLRKLIARLPQDDRMVAMHLRMRTHGNYDLSNCHPYAIAGGGYLMHNGVLSIGNDKDTSKSDTWHYCRTYLDNGVDGRVHSEEVLEIIGKHIGSNVFAIMTDDGQISLVNADRGIESNGVFFSNTYAWNPAILDPSLGFGGWMGAYEGFDRCGNHVFGGSNYGYDEAMAALDFAYAIAEGDASDAARALESVSIRDGVETLLDTHEAVGALYLDGLLSTVEKRVQAAAIAEDADELVNLLFRESYEAVEALALTIEWRERESGRWVPDEQEEPAVEHLRLHEMTDAQYEEMYAG